MKLERIRNEVIMNKVEVASRENKTREVRLREFGHIMSRSIDAPVKRCERIVLLKGRMYRG